MSQKYSPRYKTHCIQLKKHEDGAVVAVSTAQKCVFPGENGENTPDNENHEDRRN